MRYVTRQRIPTLALVVVAKIRKKVAAVPPLIFLKKLRFLKKLALCLDKEIARLSP
ncbi:hypothetical protein [uncultured Helicobacter sp.]|uniref:hypothetical protein n=1 Tax=uncultured Helicobacter sp. TaxID=175537 RepID=UPI003752F850